MSTLVFDRVEEYTYQIYIDRENGVAYPDVQLYCEKVKVRSTKAEPLSDDLPEKMSDLLEVALGDFEMCRRRYTVDMSYWLTNQTGRCTVCLAGAVMLETLKVKIPENEEFSMTPRCVGAYNGNKLVVLDCLRRGLLKDAYSVAQMPFPKYLRTVIPVPVYSVDPSTFMTTMWDLVYNLRGLGQ